MTRTRTSIALVFVVGVLAICFGLPKTVRAQRGSAAITAPSNQTEPRAPAQTTSPSATLAPESVLDNFVWLEGRWRGEWGPRVAEQAWLGPKAGEMLGVFRLAEGDKTLVIELFTLVEKSGGVDLHSRHFKPKLSSSRAEIIPESGEIQVIEITYHREKPAPEKPSAGSAGHRKKP